MLNPNNDRLDYGEILAPPPEHHVDFAIGTTYSLDLDALVGASLALGLSEETDSALANNPVCLLEALRSTGDRVALFCEGGQIHLPNRVTPLYILLEKMVFSVNTVKRRGMAAFPSFHPKFWLIRYKDTKEHPLYRVVVLSRNLTFDRSWDVTYCMDGHKTRTETSKNDPIIDFLRYLVSHLPSDENGREKAKGIRSLIRELPYIHFDLMEREFSDYEFLPNGIKDEYGDFYRIEDTSLFKDSFHEVLIISPFLSGKIVRNFNDRNLNVRSHIEEARYMLITREMSLGSLKPDDVSNFKIYTMRDNVIDGESEISEETESIQKQDIHAKVYLTRKYSTSNLYLGSLNASSNAVYGNIEFMIKLVSKNRYLNMDKLANSLFCGEEDNPNNPFQQVTLQNAIIETEDDDNERTMNSIIKGLNRNKAKAIVRQDTEESYSLLVHFGEFDTQGYKVTVRPLLSRKSIDVDEDVVFSNLSVTQLSDFYVIGVSDESKTIERVIIIPTENLTDDREKAVITSVVSDRDCFYRYIAFLLGDDSILSALEAGMVNASGIMSNNAHQLHIPALYEKMLQTAATNPEKFRGIDYLMKAISDDGIIPEEFKKLYETFKRAVKLDGKG